MNKEEIEFITQSNYIEQEYSKVALDDAIQAWTMAKICMDEPMSLDYILAIHRRLMKRLNPDIAGRIRDCPVMIGGKIKWNNKEEIRKELINWCKKYQNIKEEDIKQAHIDFEDLHPYQDGNGRTGRILMNIQRLKLGLPILIIYNSERFKYYEWFKDID